MKPRKTHAATLFGEIEPEALPSAPPAPAPDGPFAGVALEQGIDRVLDYAVPPKLRSSLMIGQRVRVPLGRGNRAAHGYVVYLHPTTAHANIKSLAAIADERVLVSPTMMQLARWISRYYVTPLGMALESVVPAAVRNRIGMGYRHVVHALRTPAEIQELLEKTRTVKRRAIFARLLQLPAGEGIELSRLAGEAGVAPPTVRRLASLGVIAIHNEPDLPAPASSEFPAEPTEPIQFNEDQQRAFDAVLPRLHRGQFSVNLLHGVTGSGKTELYLQWIARVVAEGRQALVLVPEIALTPQTVRRFEARFRRVAVLHSGLSATQRHRFWVHISQGRADVIIGARSAVFAPAANLGIIVVDEEHETSYKQDQAPRYHARDVAVQRARIEKIPVILGSATPSLEAYYRCGPNRDPAEDTSAYHYLSLPRRVRGLSMPQFEVIDMRTERRQRPGVRLVSSRLQRLLQNTLDASHQAVILLNRRGYANYVFCPSCGNVIQCKYCDTTMTYHRSAGAHAAGGSFAEGLHTGQLHCHYCLAVNPLPSACPVCGKKLTLFGLGTQRVEEELTRLFPGLRYARMDSDAMHGARDYQTVLSAFATGQTQVLLGTQMIAKGLDYPNVTLVGVISGDTALALPDFRAAERTFQLITQVSGRAGRGDSPGRVLLQTFIPDDPSIRFAVAGDYARFAESELAHRREVNLPPFTRMARIILRHRDEAKMLELSANLTEQLTKAIAEVSPDVQLRGPMPCAIGRIAGYLRGQIVLTSPRGESIQRLLAAVRPQGDLTRAESVAVDVDPVSLL